MKTLGHLDNALREYGVSENKYAYVVSWFTLHYKEQIGTFFGPFFNE